jgi:hypothetical protein
MPDPRSATLAVLLVAACGNAASHEPPAPPPRSRTDAAVADAPPAPRVPSATAYRDGGIPLHDPVLEAAFATDLLELAVAASDRKHPRLDKKRVAGLRRLLDARSPAIAREWHKFIDLLDRWQRAPKRRDVMELQSQAFTRTHALHALLAEAGLGYYFVPQLSPDAARMELFPMRVENIAAFDVGGERDHVRQLRPLVVQPPNSPLGEADEYDARIFLAAADRVVDRMILPLLADHGAMLDLGRDDTWGATDLGTRASMAIGEALRADLADVVRDPRHSRQRCIDLVVVSASRHEIQHRRDRRHPLPRPKLLTERFGEMSLTGMSVWMELSAYVSQLANDPIAPRVTLLVTLLPAFGPDRATDKQAHVGVILVEGLARHMKLPAVGDIVADEQIDRDRLAALAIPVLARSGEDLRAAAAALFAELYGTPVVSIR